MDATDEETPGGYKVGNKRPPKHSQFKKGQSGNPSGRRKSHPSAAARGDYIAAAMAMLDRQRAVVVGGKRQFLTAQETFFESLGSDAIKPGAAAKVRDLFLSVMREVQLVRPAGPPMPPDEFTKERINFSKMRHMAVFMEKKILDLVKGLDTEEKRQKYIKEKEERCRNVEEAIKSDVADGIIAFPNK
jgi:hypothetical protein